MEASADQDGDIYGSGHFQVHHVRDTPPPKPPAPRNLHRLRKSDDPLLTVAEPELDSGIFAAPCQTQNVMEASRDSIQK